MGAIFGLPALKRSNGLLLLLLSGSPKHMENARLMEAVPVAPRLSGIMQAERFLRLSLAVLCAPCKMCIALVVGP